MTSPQNHSYSQDSATSSSITRLSCTGSELSCLIGPVDGVCTTIPEKETTMLCEVIRAQIQSGPEESNRADQQHFDCEDSVVDQYNIMVHGAQHHTSYLC